MISKKAAKKKLKEIENNNFCSGTLQSTLHKAEDRPINCGSRVKRKPSLDEMDRR